MVSYDYNQLPQPNPAYPSSYATLPTQQMMDPTNQYSSLASFPAQATLPTSHYPPMMMYPPKTDTNALPPQAVPLPMQPISFPMAVNRGKSVEIFVRRYCVLRA